MRRHSAHGLEVGAARHVIEPDGTEGGDGAVRRDRDQVKIPAIERGALDVAIPGWIFPVPCLALEQPSLSIHQLVVM
jgi:hypothetical protein